MKKMLERFIGRVQERVRDLIVPLDRVAALVPSGGQVRELGCGEGLLLARIAPRVGRLIGVDYDPRKCRLARERLCRHQNTEVLEQEILEHLALAPVGTDRAVVISDTLSSFPPARQDEVLRRAVRLLEPGGVIVLKFMDTEPIWKTCISLALSTVICRMRLSRSEGQRFWYRSRHEYAAILRGLGLDVTEHLLHVGSNIAPHVALVARLPGGGQG